MPRGPHSDHAIKELFCHIVGQRTQSNIPRTSLLHEDYRPELKIERFDFKMRVRPQNNAERAGNKDKPIEDRPSGLSGQKILNSRSPTGTAEWVCGYRLSGVDSFRMASRLQ